MAWSRRFGVGAYKRKNCSTGDPVTERQPCVLRTRQAADPGQPIPDFPDPQTQEEFEALAGFPYRDLGVDLNRNYGEQWGGPGTEHTRLGTFPVGGSSGLTYHGPGPFSEPEMQAFREWSRDRNLSMLVGNHTYTGLILRPPGTSVEGPPRTSCA